MRQPEHSPRRPDDAGNGTLLLGNGLWGAASAATGRSAPHLVGDAEDVGGDVAERDAEDDGQLHHIAREQRVHAERLQWAASPLVSMTQACRSAVACPILSVAKSFTCSMCGGNGAGQKSRAGIRRVHAPERKATATKASSDSRHTASSQAHLQPVVHGVAQPYQADPEQDDVFPRVAKLTRLQTTLFRALIAIASATAAALVTLSASIPPSAMHP